MSDKQISFKHKVQGVLTDATSVVLRDTANTYGLRRQDTSAVIVASGTAFSHDGTGLYSTLFAGLVGGVNYQYAVEWVYAGETKREVRTFAAPGDSPSGMWGTYAMALGIYQENAGLWGTNSATGTPDMAIIQAAFTRAGTDMATEFVMQNYAVPGPTHPMAAKLGYIEAELMGAYLYESNGLQDSAKGMDGKMQGHRDNAMGQLQELLFYNRGGFARVAGYSDAPAGVGPTVDALGRNVGATPPFPRPTWNGSFWTWG